MAELVVYDALTHDNVAEILYRVINAEALVPEKPTADWYPKDQRVSSNPFFIAEREFTPCAITPKHPRDYTDTVSPVEVIHSLQRDYPHDVFWHGMDKILDDVLSGSAEFAQLYSPRELFHSFYGLERTAPQEISDKLQKIVDDGKFKQVDAYTWFGDSNLLVHKWEVNIHYVVAFALAVHQKNIGASYWLGKLEQEPEYFLGYFSGLAHCDIAEAQNYLGLHSGRMPVEDKDMGVVLRSAQRRLDKHNKP